MCFPTPTIPSLPGASPTPPHSPTSVPTPGPAATPSSPLAPEATPVPLAVGRSKALRWRDDGSPESSSVASPGLHRRRPSYKEALLLPRPAPFLGREDDFGASWVTVEGRQARRRRLRHLKPPPLSPRVVPSDLRGKCFNCFSPSHRAAVCRRQVRCFCCRLPGHRAYVCPRRRSAAPLPQRGLVWRPVSLSSGMAGSNDSLAGRVVDGGEDGGGVLKRRTRRGLRRRRSGNLRDSADQDAIVAVPSQRPADQCHDRALGRPRRIIKHSRMILQAEDNLRRALIITVIDQSNSGCAADVSDALAVRFNLDAQTLDLRRAAPNSFIAFLPNEEVACRVFNGGIPFVSPTVRLHIKRWSRHAMAVGGRELPVPVDIELRGIPAHLWGLETATQLLDEYCLIRDVHPDSAEGGDLSVFKLSAWCDEPELVPAELDLLAEEPQLGASDFGSFPHTLVFPITVRVCRSDAILDRRPSPPPQPPFSGDDREQNHGKRRRDQHSISSVPGRRPVHARLGPGVRTDSAPGGTCETIALPVPLGAVSTASASRPRARLGPCGGAGSAPGCTVGTFSAPGPLSAVVAVGAEEAASGSTIPTPAPLVSPPTALVTSVIVPGAANALTTGSPSEDPGPASLIGAISSGLLDSERPILHDNSFNVAAFEEAGGFQRLGQGPENLCADASGRASVPFSHVPHVPDVPADNAAQVRNPWDIIKYSLQAKPPCFKVYSRRRDTVPVQSQEVSSPSPTPLQEFSQHISKAINGLLSPPPIPKRRKKTLPRNFRPRRSRRVAKFPPELGSDAAASVCKKLGFCDDHGNITLEDASKYAVLFNSPLSREHIAALAALFGWDTSELA